MTDDQTYIIFETTYTIHGAGKLIATHSILKTEHSMDLALILAQTKDLIGVQEAIIDNCRNEHLDLFEKTPVIIQNSDFIEAARCADPGGHGVPRGETSERIVLNEAQRPD